jgi:hypothetical protein
MGWLDSWMAGRLEGGRIVGRMDGGRIFGGRSLVNPYCTISCSCIRYRTFMLLCNVHLILIIFSHVYQPSATVSYCVVMQNR